MTCDSYNKTVQDDECWEALLDTRNSNTDPTTQTYLTPRPVAFENQKGGRQ